MIRLLRWLFGGAPPRRELWPPVWGSETPPDDPMTPTQALAHLTVTHPCGCVEQWYTSPPSGVSCQAHIGTLGMTAKMPRYFNHAHAVLRAARSRPEAT